MQALYPRIRSSIFTVETMTDRSHASVYHPEAYTADRESTGTAIIVI